VAGQPSAPKTQRRPSQFLVDSGLLPTESHRELWDAIGANNLKAVRSILRRNKYLLDHSDVVGRNMLDVVAVEGTAKMAELLISYGLQVDDPARTKSNVLVEATARKNIPVMRVLLAHGADPNREVGERSPRLTVFQYNLSWCGRSRGYGDARELEPVEDAKQRLPVLRILLEDGADVRRRIEPSSWLPEGETPIMLAKRFSGLFGKDLAALLREFGATE
jgi:hypothetical protein